jgi:hypothetical protein
LDSEERWAGRGVAKGRLNRLVRLDKLPGVARGGSYGDCIARLHHIGTLLLWR